MEWRTLHNKNANIDPCHKSKSKNNYKPEIATQFRVAFTVENNKAVQERVNISSYKSLHTNH